MHKVNAVILTALLTSCRQVHRQLIDQVRNRSSTTIFPCFPCLFGYTRHIRELAHETSYAASSPISSHLSGSHICSTCRGSGCATTQAHERSSIQARHRH